MKRSQTTIRRGRSKNIFKEIIKKDLEINDSDENMVLNIIL